MTRQSFFAVFFILLLAVISYQVFVVFSPFIHPIFWAAILAFTFYPIHRSMLGIFKNRENLTAVLTTFGILLLVAPLVIVILVKLTNQSIEFLRVLDAFVREGRLREWVSEIRSYPWVQNLEATALRLEGMDKALADWILKGTREGGRFAVEQAGVITKNVLLFSLGFILTFFLVFFFLRDGHKIYEFFYDIAPLEEKEKRMIFGHITDTFAAVIRGQLLTAFVQALLAGSIFYFLGLPMPVLIGAVTFLGSLIPFIGASSVWIPFVIYLFASAQAVKAVILLILGIFVISLVDNFLKPALIGEKTKLPYSLLFLGILGGVKVYGFAGIFLAPVLLSVFFALIGIYRERYMAE